MEFIIQIQLYKQIYKELILRAGDNFYQIDTYIKIAKSLKEDNKILKIIAELENIKSYFETILAQTIPRIVDHESVPAQEKIISLFEEHTDVIFKSRREVEFWHKIFFTTGKSNLILDCQIELGNPADSSKFIDLINAQEDIYGRVPLQKSADGGFSSKDNVQKAKDLGVRDVCFSKRCGLEILDMVKSSLVFDKLKRFRAGIESNISALKRVFGLDRANWKGLLGYKSYIWSSVVACNLTILANKL